MGIAKQFLLPIIDLAKDGKIPESTALDFVKIKYQHILKYAIARQPLKLFISSLHFSYCTNIYMYLLLKLSRVNIKNHPVAKRLYQYRKILSQFDPIFEDTIKPQIEILLQENLASNNMGAVEKRKTLKILKKLTKRNAEPEICKEENTDVEISKEPVLKKRKLIEQASSDSEDSGVENEIHENTEDKSGRIFLVFLQMCNQQHL